MTLPDDLESVTAIDVTGKVVVIRLAEGADLGMWEGTLTAFSKEFVRAGAKFMLVLDHDTDLSTVDVDTVAAQQAIRDTYTGLAEEMVGTALDTIYGLPAEFHKRAADTPLDLPD